MAGRVGLALHVVGEIEEKIVVKGCGDAGKQLAVNGWTREDVIDIGPVTVDLPGKPCGRATALLAVKNFFDCFAYVSHFVGGREAVQRAVARSTRRNRIKTREITINIQAWHLPDAANASGA